MKTKLLVYLVALLLALMIWGASEANAMELNDGHVAGLNTVDASKQMHKNYMKKIRRRKMREKQAEEKRKQEEFEWNWYLLAHLIYAENGDDRYSEYQKAMQYTGSVLLNRVKSSRYPDTIEECIFQRGQYACTWDGHFEHKPSKEAWDIAKGLLIEGSCLPEDVLYAAEFVQGDIYDKVAGTYYCY